MIFESCIFLQHFCNDFATCFFGKQNFGKQNHLTFCNRSIHIGSNSCYSFVDLQQAMGSAEAMKVTKKPASMKTTKATKAMKATKAKGYVKKAMKAMKRVTRVNPIFELPPGTIVFPDDKMYKHALRSGISWP